MGDLEQGQAALIGDVYLLKGEMDQILEALQSLEKKEDDP